MNRFFKSITLAGILALGIGCGGTELDETQPQETQEMAAVEQAADEGTEARKVEDMIAALDSGEGVLHVQEGSQDIALRELQAQPQRDGSYVTKDELTGDQTRFVIKPYPVPSWPQIFIRCPTGQWVPYWQKCPANIYSDLITRIWIRSSCSWKVQSASYGLCVNSGSSSYRYQYMEAWRCGVGTGICRERRAVTAIRFNYAYAACNSSVITSVTNTSFNYLCKK